MVKKKKLNYKGRTILEIVKWKKDAFKNSGKDAITALKSAVEMFIKDENVTREKLDKVLSDVSSNLELMWQINNQLPREDSPKKG